MNKFFKNNLYYIGCGLIGMALAHAKIYYYSVHFWLILGAAYLTVFAALWKAEK